MVAIPAGPARDPNVEDLLGPNAPKFEAPRPAPDIIPYVARRKLRIDWSLVGVYVGALAGLVVLGIAALIFTRELTSIGPIALRKTHALDVLALSFLVGGGPFSLREWRGRQRRRSIDLRLPDFLTDLASLHKAGLTLPDSLVTASKGSYGPLTKEVREAAEQLRWNIPVLTVLDNMKQRIGTTLSERTLTVVLEAGKTGGNVPEVLEIAANNARATVRMRETRARSMALYVIITYVASLVFLGVALALQGIFVPKMIAAFSAIGGGGGGLGFAALPEADAFRTLFLTAALVQSAGNGVVGGVMADGSVIGGVKHAWIMTLLTLLGFQLTG